MTVIEAKLDAMMNKLGSNERRMHTAHEVGAVEEGIVSLTATCSVVIKNSLPEKM